MDLPSTDVLEQRVAQLLRLWRVPPAAAVGVRWNPRLRSSAGRAFAAAGRIELNPGVLAAAPAEIDVVLTHEAAHVAAHRLFGARVAAHGRHWRALMRLAGRPPEITHDLPVPPRQRRRRRYFYLRVCDACGHRRLGRTVRYDRCRCGTRSRFLVLRSGGSAAGYDTLARMPLHEVRRHFASADP